MMLNFYSLFQMSIEKLIDFCEGLKTNTCLETLEMASVAATDSVAKVRIVIMFSCSLIVQFELFS